MDYLIHIITSVGYWGYAIIFIIIFFESFPITFFLPGDSLLFTTGFLASQGYFSLPVLVGTLFLGSVLGFMFSYATGQKIREFILNSHDKYWFKKKHLDYTHEFFAKYGDKTIIIGRFVPIVRSFSATLAGSVQMPYRRFIRDTVIGGFIWTAGVTIGGFYLSQQFPVTRQYLTPIILLIVFISLLPAILEYFRKRKS